MWQGGNKKPRYDTLDRLILRLPGGCGGGEIVAEIVAEIMAGIMAEDTCVGDHDKRYQGV